MGQERNMQMRYHNITRDDMLNGYGLRAVLWIAGCSHCCKECHNPITWDPDGGILFDEDAKKELFDELKKDYISGITLSGGDPLYSGNLLEVEELVKEIRQTFPKKTIWLYTGGLWEDVKKYSLVKYLDVLVDGEYECEKKDSMLHWRGSSNQRVIDVQESLKQGKAVLHCE